MRCAPTLAGAAAAALLTLSACSDVTPPAAPESPSEAHEPRETGANPPGVAVAPGYFLRPLVTGLDFPTAIAFSENDGWVAEAGHLPGLAPKVKHLSAEGDVTTILSGDALGNRLLPPLTDVTYHDGWLWITHRQMGVNGWMVGAISKFRPEDPMGTFTTVLTNLPSSGDHHTNEIVFGADGRAYFPQGTATNSSVVGPDNYLITQWLKNFPQFHDFPAKDIVLNGVGYKTPVPFPLDPEADDITAPFMPFGSGPVAPGTVVQGVPRDGIVAGNGTVYSFDPRAMDATPTLRLEAWGLRNPFGLGFNPFHPNQLFVTNNGADTRGVAGETNIPIDPEDLVIVEPRPIEGDYDDFYRLEVGGAEEFFGWPDYFHDPRTGEVLPVTHPLFCGELENCPEFVLDESFRNSLNVRPAFAQFALHSSANKFDFSTSRGFGFVSHAFVAETGSFVPITGAIRFTGYKVVRVDNAGQVRNFIVNLGNTAAEIFDPQGFNKPIDVKFKGQVMLIVDFGVFEPGLDLQQPGTGKIWAVCSDRALCDRLPRSR